MTCLFVQFAHWTWVGALIFEVIYLTFFYLPDIESISRSVFHLFELIQTILYSESHCFHRLQHLQVRLLHRLILHIN